MGQRDDLTRSRLSASHEAPPKLLEPCCNLASSICFLDLPHAREIRTIFEAYVLSSRFVKSREIYDLIRHDKNDIKDLYGKFELDTGPIGKRECDRYLFYNLNPILGPLAPRVDQPVRDFFDSLIVWAICQDEIARGSLWGDVVYFSRQLQHTRNIVPSKEETEALREHFRTLCEGFSAHLASVLQEERVSEINKQLEKSKNAYLDRKEEMEVLICRAEAMRQDAQAFQLSLLYDEADVETQKQIAITLGNLLHVDGELDKPDALLKGIQFLGYFKGLPVTIDGYLRALTQSDREYTEEYQQQLQKLEDIYKSTPSAIQMLRERLDKFCFGKMTLGRVRERHESIATSQYLRDEACARVESYGRDLQIPSERDFLFFVETQRFLANCPDSGTVALFDVSQGEVWNASYRVLEFYRDLILAEVQNPLFHQSFGFHLLETTSSIMDALPILSIAVKEGVIGSDDYLRNLFCEACGVESLLHIDSHSQDGGLQESLASWLELFSNIDSSTVIQRKSAAQPLEERIKHVLENVTTSNLPEIYFRNSCWMVISSLRAEIDVVQQKSNEGVVVRRLIATLWNSLEDGDINRFLQRITTLRYLGNWTHRDLNCTFLELLEQLDGYQKMKDFH
jgi:hypothetical protein